MLVVRLDRVFALCYRYLLVLSRSSFRVMDIVFWPVMDLLVWGFVSSYFAKSGGVVSPAVSFLVGGIIFFNVLYRAQQSISVSFLEDLWSRNLLSIFVSPITVAEFVSATYVVGVAQSVTVTIIMSLMASLLYAFDIFSMSWYLIPLFVNLLVMGWWLGLGTTAFILRYGYQAEALAWAVPFLLQPVSAVFYPVSVLPTALQAIAWLLPSTYVFEGMRNILQGGADSTSTLYLVKAALFNLLYWTVTVVFFGKMLSRARERGSLAKIVV